MMVDFATALCGTAFLAYWFLHTALRPERLIRGTDSWIETRGRRSAVWLGVFHTAIPTVALSALTVWRAVFPLLWGVVCGVFSVGAILMFFSAWVVEDSLDAPRRTRGELRLAIKKKRAASVLPLVLLVLWLSSWLPRLTL